ncbi:MAG: hypothetical protein GX020_00685 [Firmicutes bacterium]|nr:hypothetical protein [Bacillota bacterium]
MRKTSFRVLILSLVFVLIGAGICFTAGDDSISLDFKDTDIRDVLRAISVQSGKNVVAAPEVVGSVTIRLSEVSMDEALNYLLSSYGWALEIEGNLYRVVKDTTDSSYRVTLEDGLINIYAEDAPLERVLLSLAEVSNISIIPIVDLTGSIYARLNSLTFEQCLTHLLKSSNLTWVKDGDVYVIDSVSERPERQALTVVFENDLLWAQAIDVYIEDLYQEIATQAGLDLVILPEVFDQVRVRINIHGMELTSALDYISEIYGLKIEDTGTFFAVAFKEQESIQDQEETTIIHLELPEGLEMLMLQNDLLYTQLNGIFLVDFLRVLVERYPELPPIIVDEQVANKRIVGAVFGLPVHEGLKHLIAPYGLLIKEIAEGYQIETKPAVAPFTVDYFDGLLTIKAERASLWDLLREIGRKTNVTFIMPESTPIQVSFEINSVKPDKAVTALLSRHNYVLSSYPSGSKELTPWEGIYSVEPVVVKNVRVTVSGGLLSLSASEALLSEIINELSAVTGENILFQQGYNPSLSIELYNLSLDDLLNALVFPYGGTVKNQGNFSIIQIHAPTQGTPIITRSQSTGIETLELDNEGIVAIFSELSLSELFSEINNLSGPRFIAESFIEKDLVSGQIIGNDVESAIKSFLFAKGYKVVPLSNGYLVRSINQTQPLIHYEGGLFYLDISGGELALLIKELANKAGKSIVTYSQVRGNVSSMQVIGLSFEQALEHLLRGTTFTYYVADDIYYIGEGITPRVEAPEFTQSKVIRLNYLAPSDLISLLPPSIPSHNIRPIPGESAVVAFGSQSILKAIDEFVMAVDIPSNKVTELITIRYADAEEIVNVITRSFTADTFQYLPSSNAILLTGTPQNNARIRTLVENMDTPDSQNLTRVIALNHIAAEEAKNLMEPAIDSSKMLVIPDQNSLVISGRLDQIERAEDYLRSIDKPNPQIVFEVMIVEVSRRTSDQLGFSGSTADGTFKFDLLGGSPFTLSLGSAFLADPSFTLTLSALVQQGQAKLLANPHIATLNGKEASFNVLTTARYWAPQTVTDEDQKGNSNVIPAFRTIETGIRLYLKPWISANGDITIELNPEISDSAGSTSGSSLPSTNDRSISTTVRVKDGETIVIGGLIQRREQVEISKVPVLGDLPIIGRLFTVENKEETETEFIIAITSHLLD